MSLARRSSGALSSRDAQAPAATDELARPSAPRVTRLEWRAGARRVGWEVLPALVRGALAEAGWCRRDPVAAWADAETVRRDGAGGFVGVVGGWWADPRFLVTVLAARPLRRLEPGARRFAPTGSWTASVRVHPLAGEARTTRWRRPASAPSGPEVSAGPGAAVWDNRSQPTAILPSAVARRLEIGGIGPSSQGAVRQRRRGGGWREDVYAYVCFSAGHGGAPETGAPETGAPGDGEREGGQRLVAVGATRAAGSWPDPERAIAHADWVITVLDAVVGAGSCHELPAVASGSATQVPLPRAMPALRDGGGSGEHGGPVGRATGRRWPVPDADRGRGESGDGVVGRVWG